MAQIPATFSVLELLLPSAALFGANAPLVGCMGSVSLRASALLLFLREGDGVCHSCPIAWVMRLHRCGGVEVGRG